MKEDAQPGDAKSDETLDTLMPEVLENKADAPSLATPSSPAKSTLTSRDSGPLSVHEVSNAVTSDAKDAAQGLAAAITTDVDTGEGSNQKERAFSPLPTDTDQLPSADAQQLPPKPLPKAVRMYHDETLVSFFRRLTFSPDGSLLVTPTGQFKLGHSKADLMRNATFVFGRGKIRR